MTQEKLPHRKELCLQSEATFVLQPKVAFSFEIISYAYADQMSDNSSLFGTEGIPPLF